LSSLSLWSWRPTPSVARLRVPNHPPRLRPPVSLRRMEQKLTKLGKKRESVAVIGPSPRTGIRLHEIHSACRLHCSTYGAVLLTAVLLVVLIVPGQATVSDWISAARK
ncbi:MAG TPA: hypothetical protein VJ783_05215, partial [Pirellulales bacterium]|nr:hypothetical protein [Pirellulales bacterium]